MDLTHIPPNPNPHIALVPNNAANVLLEPLPTPPRSVSRIASSVIGLLPYTLVRGVNMNGDMPPNIMAVVVLYAAVCGLVPIDLERSTRLGLTRAAL